MNQPAKTDKIPGSLHKVSQIGAISIGLIKRPNTFDLGEGIWVAWDTRQILAKVAPPEHEEQALGVSVLKAAKIPRFSVPNGGLKDLEAATKQKREGMEPGIPDLVLVRAPPVACEFKKANGDFSDVADRQWKWLWTMVENGWVAGICFGYKAMLGFLHYRGEAVPTRNLGL